jgi:hypothetical protein
MTLWCSQAAALAGLAGIAFSSGFDMSKVLGAAFVLVTAIVADQVGTDDAHAQNLKQQQQPGLNSACHSLCHTV